MTPKEAKRRVDAIRKIAGDCEFAHSSEDSLYLAFVRYVASRPGPHSETAKEILKTQDIRFSRWFA